MRVELEVPAYSRTTGAVLLWDDGFEISVSISADATLIRGNAEGLRSLARHLLLLSMHGVPAGTHIHLDAESALEDGSRELILERTA
jgi:hypothetical protein